MCVIAFLGLYLFYKYYSTQRKSTQEASERPLGTDVFISSFPKCGSFWGRFLMASVYSIVTRDSTSRVTFDTIETLIPDLELGENRRNFAGHQEIFPGLRLFKVRICKES
jgi:hypothetical protein